MPWPTRKVRSVRPSSRTPSPIDITPTSVIDGKALVKLVPPAELIKARDEKRAQAEAKAARKAAKKAATFELRKLVKRLKQARCVLWPYYSSVVD